MRNVLILALAVAFAGTAAKATDISFSVRSGGSNEVTVTPSAEVTYEVFGVLSSDTDNEGLALVGLDLEFSGGALEQADEPTEDPMANFVMDEGITNPAGYGGTVIDGNLVQIGGGQNTIINVLDNAPFPIGAVIPEVAYPPDGVVLVTGTLTAPTEEGSYTLALTNAFANVIQEGEDGSPFWATEAATVGEVVNLIVNVVDCVIVGADPPDGAIDGRQPASPSDGCQTPEGWAAIDIEFTCATAGMLSTDFTITVDPADVTLTITGVSTDGNTASLTLDGVIPTGHWTTFTHNSSGTSTTLGNLPGDVNGDRTTGPVDVLDLIDHLNGVITLPEWGTDADRNGATNSADILTVIDLLNGAGCFDPWNGEALP